MKPSRILLSLCCLLGPVFILRADDVPTRPKFDRYAGMLNRSPFAVATAAAAPAATPNFAKDLYVANAAHVGDAELVTLQSAVDRNMKEYLSTKETNPRGFKIVSVEWSDRPGETKVTISKDSQVAVLAFNQALMAQPASPSSAAVQPVQAAPLPGGGGYMPPKPAAMPNMPPPTPHVRGTIQRVPSSAAINAPNSTAPAEKD
jgi:hypothetical protein